MRQACHRLVVLATVLVMKLADDVWIVDVAGDSPWREVTHYEGKPEALAIRMRFAPTAEGVAVAGVQIERTDGHALTARDLRAVRLPPNWLLWGESAQRWYQSDGEAITRSRKGPKDRGDDKHRMVWDLWCQAQEVAPRAPVRWMLAQDQIDVSDATVRRWIKRAKERAAALGWPPPVPPLQ